MPRKINPNAAHRIPVRDHALFEELREFAISKNWTWEEYLTASFDAIQRNNRKPQRESGHPTDGGTS